MGVIPRRLYDATNTASPNGEAHARHVSLPCEPWMEPIAQMPPRRPTCEVCGCSVGEGKSRCGLHVRSRPHHQKKRGRNGQG